MLKVGTKAPDFTLLDQYQKSHSLKEYRGKKVLLYFYPKDNTPGCTKQACQYSLLENDFKENNVVVLGISKDSLSSHEKFANKFELKFPILSDEKLEVIRAYDVWKEKKNYGKTYMGVVRTTYLIDENGVIEKANDKVKAAEDAQKMLEELQRA